MNLLSPLTLLPKCGPQTISLGITWEMLRKADCQTPSRTPKWLVSIFKGKKCWPITFLGAPPEYLLLFMISSLSWAWGWLVCYQPGEVDLFGQALRGPEVMASYGCLPNAFYWKYLKDLKALNIPENEFLMIQFQALWQALTTIFLDRKGSNISDIAQILLCNNNLYLWSILILLVFISYLLYCSCHLRGKQGSFGDPYFMVKNWISEKLGDMPAATQLQRRRGRHLPPTSGSLCLEDQITGQSFQKQLCANWSLFLVFH